MRIVQRVFLYIVSVVLVVLGIGIAAIPFSDKAGAIAAKASQLPDSWMLCIFVGCALGAFGLFTLLPFDIFKRKGRSITFGGDGGTVVIQLESFEASLRKTIAKLPMVKKAYVTVAPEDNNRKVAIETDVSIKKPGDMSTREAGERLREFILKAARNILGSDEVTRVIVRVNDIEIDSNQTADSLKSVFAAAEKSVTPVATAVVAAPIAVAASAAVQEPVVYADEPELDDMVEEKAPHSEELLTYDESEALQDAPEPAIDDDEEADPRYPMEDEPSAGSNTAFESLHDDGDEEPKPDKQGLI